MALFQGLLNEVDFCVAIIEDGLDVLVEEILQDLNQLLQFLRALLFVLQRVETDHQSLVNDGDTLQDVLASFVEIPRHLPGLLCSVLIDHHQEDVLHLGELLLVEQNSDVQINLILKAVVSLNHVVVQDFRVDVELGTFDDVPKEESNDLVYELEPYPKLPPVHIAHRNGVRDIEDLLVGSHFVPDVLLQVLRVEQVEIVELHPKRTESAVRDFVHFLVIVLERNEPQIKDSSFQNEQPEVALISHLRKQLRLICLEIFALGLLYHPEEELVFQILSDGAVDDVDVGELLEVIETEVLAVVVVVLEVLEVLLLENLRNLILLLQDGH